MPTPRIALIHALVQSIDPVNDEMERAWPECERMNILDDSLSADLARGCGALDASFNARFDLLADYAVRTGVQGILFTCSAFGPCIEGVARRLAPLPVLKPNEAMIAEAAAIGRRVGLVASFAPTRDAMPGEFPSSVSLSTALAVGALASLRGGDVDQHDAIIVEAAKGLVAQGCEVIVLAQFSMARAAPAVEQALDVQVLTTVGSAVRALRARVGDLTRNT